MAKVEIIKQKGFNFLWIDDYLWMWDIPCEHEEQNNISDQAYGEVLVAGYGLGIVQKYLCQNPLVTSVLTVEILPELISAVKMEYGQLYGEVALGDFYHFEANKKFDCVIGDIWEDIEPKALDRYNSFKKKAESFVKPGGKILAWGQWAFEALNSKQ